MPVGAGRGLHVLHPWSYGLLSLAWSAATSALALLAFHVRTRPHCRIAPEVLAGTPHP
ncbi:hypothetical protein ACFQ3Z_40685 [Streptomyces nogalater]